MSVGIGYDSHRFAAGRPLVLGGVEIEHERGLDGPLRRRRPHPRGDRRPARGRRPRRHRHPLPRRRRALARRRLDRPAADRRRDDRAAGSSTSTRPWSARSRGSARYRAEMERILAEATSARVSVKATTNEGMGWIGRGEGIACIAVASVRERIVFAIAMGTLSSIAVERPQDGRRHSLRGEGRCTKPGILGLMRPDKAPPRSAPPSCAGAPRRRPASRPRRSTTRTRRRSSTNAARSASSSSTAAPTPSPTPSQRMGIGYGDGIGIMCRNHRGFIEATARRRQARRQRALPEHDVRRPAAGRGDPARGAEGAGLRRGVHRPARGGRRRASTASSPGADGEADGPTLDSLIAANDDSDLKPPPGQSPLRDPHLGHDRDPEGRPALQPRRPAHASPR